MKDLIKYFTFTLFAVTPLVGFGQPVMDQISEEIFEGGSFITSFSFDVRTASKDENFNQEFEKSFELVGFNVEGLYFIHKKFGIGPVLGLHYVHQFYDAPGVIFQDQDVWNWDWEYGAKVGYYTPISSLFKSDVLGSSQFFATTGISKTHSKAKVEDSNTGQRNTFTIDPEVRYQMAIGLYTPVGENIGIEWKIKRDVWQRDYMTFEFDTNNNLVSTGETTKWLFELTIGMALNLNF